MVVKGSMGFRNDDLSLHPREIWQLQHFFSVVACRHRTSREAERGRSARRDEGATGSCERSQPFANLLLQLMDWDKILGGLLHSVDHFNGHQRPTKRGYRPDRVDRSPNSQSLINRG